MRGKTGDEGMRRKTGDEACEERRGMTEWEDGGGKRGMGAKGPGFRFSLAPVLLPPSSRLTQTFPYSPHLHHGPPFLRTNSHFFFPIPQISSRPFFPVCSHFSPAVCVLLPPRLCRLRFARPERMRGWVRGGGECSTALQRNTSGQRPTPSHGMQRTDGHQRSSAT
jgi:hypothetical protein